MVRPRPRVAGTIVPRVGAAPAGQAQARSTRQGGRARHRGGTVSRPGVGFGACNARTARARTWNRRRPPRATHCIIRTSIAAGNAAGSSRLPRRRGRDFPAAPPRPGRAGRRPGRSGATRAAPAGASAGASGHFLPSPRRDFAHAANSGVRPRSRYSSSWASLSGSNSILNAFSYAESPDSASLGFLLCSPAVTTPQ